MVLPCSEGLEWVVSLEVSAGVIGWKFGWLEIVKNGRFTRFKGEQLSLSLPVKQSIKPRIQSSLSSFSICTQTMNCLSKDAE